MNADSRIKEYNLILAELSSLPDNHSIRDFLNNSSYEISETLNYTEIVELLKAKKIPFTPEMIKLYILNHILFNLVTYEKITSLENQLSEVKNYLLNIKKISPSELTKLLKIPVN